MGKSRVKDLVIAITYQCNSRCRMCGIWRKNYAGNLKASDFTKLPPHLSNINLSGGEPFLRSDLPQIVEVIKKTCLRAKVIISTNGFASDRIVEQIKIIKTIVPDIGVAISIDGIGQAHDEIRGVPLGFDKIISTISGLKKLGLKNLKLAFTLGDYNVDELENVYNLSRELGLEMSLAAVHSGEKYFSANNPIMREHDIAAVLDWVVWQELRSLSIKRWLRAYFAFGLKEFILTGRRILPDYSGRYNLFIDPDGDIYPCDVSSHKIGNLQQGFDNLTTVSAKENPSWMICTTRMAIKKHWHKFIFWLVKAHYENIINK